MTVSDFLSSMLEMFEANPDGLVLDAEIIGFFRVALEEVIQASEVMERSVAVLADEMERADEPDPDGGYAAALRRQMNEREIQTSRLPIPLDDDRRVLIMPNAIRMGVPFS